MPRNRREFARQDRSPSEQQQGKDLVTYLKMLQGMTHDEIAADLGVARTTVFRRIDRVRQLLVDSDQIVDETKKVMDGLTPLAAEVFEHHLHKRSLKAANGILCGRSVFVKRQEHSGDIAFRSPIDPQAVDEQLLKAAAEKFGYELVSKERGASEQDISSIEDSGVKPDADPDDDEA